MRVSKGLLYTSRVHTLKLVAGQVTSQFCFTKQMKARTWGLDRAGFLFTDKVGAVAR